MSSASGLDPNVNYVLRYMVLDPPLGATYNKGVCNSAPTSIGTQNSGSTGSWSGVTMTVPNVQVPGGAWLEVCPVQQGANTVVGEAANHTSIFVV